MSGVSDYNIKIHDVTIDHGSSFINNGQMGGVAADDDTAAILRELRGIREQLEKTEPIVAQAVAQLEDAVKAQDRLAVSKIARQLSTGFAASLFANLASGGLLTWLGMR